MADLKLVIFDLDGVITDTASVHSKAWKWVFDEFMTRKLGPGNFREFSLDDYNAYVDGNPRYVGVQKFLESRGFQVEYGKESDLGWDTICGIGNSKDRHFSELLVSDGVEVFEDSLELIREIRQQTNIKCAVASSSKNCRLVLEKVGLIDAFDIIHDGVSSRELGLRGKPDPDIFVRTMVDLHVDPENSVVIEDAISGVQAARASGAGFVLGLDRKHLGLENFGAHQVVTTLRGVTLQKLDDSL